MGFHLWSRRPLSFSRSPIFFLRTSPVTPANCSFLGSPWRWISLSEVCRISRPLDPYESSSLVHTVRGCRLLTQVGLINSSALLVLLFYGPEVFLVVQPCIKPPPQADSRSWRPDLCPLRTGSIIFRPSWLIKAAAGFLLAAIPRTFPRRHPGGAHFLGPSLY